MAWKIFTPLSMGYRNQAKQFDEGPKIVYYRVADNIQQKGINRSDRLDSKEWGE